MSHIDLMAGVQYRIINGFNLARNLPGGGQQGPQMTDITMTVFSGVYSNWELTPAGPEGPYVFTITNAGSRNKAYVRAEDKGVPVFGFSEEGTKFAIERAGPDEYVIKAINKDLLWTVRPGPGPEGNIFLAPADGSPAQRFRIQRFEELV